MDRLIRPAARRRRAGFTLIEVMVAMSMLAGGLLAVAAAQIYAMQGGSSGRHSSDAAAIANSQLENFQRLAFNDALLAPSNGEWVDGDPVETVVQTTPEDTVEMAYTVRGRIANVTDNLKAVDTQVGWDEPKRPGRAVTLSTRIHDDPLTGG